MKDIDWRLMTAQTTSSQDFLKTVQDGFLQQFVDFPTREQSTLDLVFSNETDRILRVKGAGKIGQADHDALDITVLGKQTLQ